MTKRDPINPTDSEARKIAQGLLSDVRFGAIAVTHPDAHTPYAARIALLWHDAQLLTLISTLSLHTKALQANPQCAALLGEPADKGDPLTHPRITLMCEAIAEDKAVHRTVWLDAIPKAKLYYDFSDFQMYRLDIKEAHLNGGFGKAYRLNADDLTS